MMHPQIGTHVARVEGDTLFFHPVGDLNLQEVLEYFKLAEQVVAQRGGVYFIDDISKLGSAPPEVRRVAGDWLGHNPCLGVALYGGSVAARTIALLVVGVTRMLGKLSFPIVFVKSEQEARDWVKAQHRKRAKTQS